MDIYIHNNENKYEHMELFCYDTKENTKGNRTILNSINFSKDWVEKNHLEVKSIELYTEETIKKVIKDLIIEFETEFPKGILKLFKKKLQKQVKEILLKRSIR